MKKVLKAIFDMPLNIPNCLTLARICMVPVFLWCYLTAQEEMDFLVSAGILLLSGITDVVDGIIARSSHCITQWGMAMDPIADKLTQVSAVVGLWIRYPGLWVFFTLLVVKELLIIIGGMRLYNKFDQVDGSRWFGKLSTVVFHLIVLYIIAKGTLTEAQILPLVCVIMVFMVFSIIMYTLRYLSTLRQQNKCKG